MSPTPATYSFLPWLKQGLGKAIAQSESDPNPALRASIPVQLNVTASGAAGAVAVPPIPRDVHLFGPGDIVGIERRAIIKTEPRHWITNFEPNYLVHIDFYDEDFAWRYTPARADTTTHRHTPWLALIVLAEGEFTDGAAAGQPLPFIELADFTNLPPKQELWAWAHVHANANLGAGEDERVSDDSAAIASRLAAVLRDNQDRAHCRIVCPRRLAANKAYHAFLVPSFESGRVAGLGLDLSKVNDALLGAWEDHAERGNLMGQALPYYHRWYFRTGNAGDFEYLVRLLKPQALAAKVGFRDYDVQKPGSNIRGIVGPNGDGTLRLGGALKVPRKALTMEEAAELDRFEAWDQPAPHQFQSDLATFINLKDSYAQRAALEAHQAPSVPEGLGKLADGATDPDPLITPPLYGRWHALTERLLTERDGSPAPQSDNWVHELNLDPRHRTAAGLGVRVVRTRQEEYMNRAWEQVGDVLEANRRLRQAEFAKAIMQAMMDKHLSPLEKLSPTRFLSLVAPVHRRVLHDGVTVHKQVTNTAVPRALLGPNLRRVVRPHGRLARAHTEAGEPRIGTLQVELVSALSKGLLTSAEPARPPANVASVAGVAEKLAAPVPQWLRATLRGLPDLPLGIVLIGILLAAFLAVLLPLLFALVVLALAAVVAAILARYGALLKQADTLRPENETSEAVAQLPLDAGFAVTRFGQPYSFPTGGTDSPEALRFKAALSSMFELSDSAASLNQPPTRTPLATTALSAGLLSALDPQRTVAKWAFRSIQLPARIKRQNPEDVREIQAYPRIDEPMYRPLAALGSELFFPNVGLIPQNSITLLETNQPFIESYMVGLNHEFSRELMWREYPTDLRGSYFRQFWDVSGYQDGGAADTQELREKLYDIPKLHNWSKDLPLGSFDHRQPPGSPAKDEVVLAIRGELLKRYPTAVIYAHRAAWQVRGGEIDKSSIRRPVELTPEQEANPPRAIVKTPLYEAKVEPDITFFGFDLSVEQAVGDPDADDPGWFFIIQERPGEPRFGLDISRDGAPINTWSDLSWEDVTVDGNLLRIRVGMTTHSLTTPPPASEGLEELQQHNEDKQIVWDEASNSADIAYVLCQLPVLVAVHAAEMLPREGAGA